MTSRVWQTGPSGHTPITAAAMNGIEADLDTALAVPDAALAGRVVAGATATALNSTFVPKWKAATAYLAGDAVLNPSGDVVTAIANFTSGASYNAANWSTSAVYLNRATKTVTDPGQTGDANLVVTGMNRSTAGGAVGIIRGEAQAASMTLNNNTGADLALSHAYEAIQFTAPAGTTQYGAVKIRLKKSAGMIDSATITANIYTDSAGAPATLQSLNNGPTVIHAQSLSSSAYQVTEFLLRINSASPTNYWVVFTLAGLGGGTFIIDSAATGGGNYSYSTNGTTWTAVPGSKPYLELRGQNPAGLQGTSETYVGVRGDSDSYYGVYGNTNSGIGVHGGSVDGVGCEGISQTGQAGVRGIGSNGYGVKGDGTNYAGVYGSGTGIGVQGVSTGNFGGVEGDNSSTGPGVYGANSGTGPGVKAETLTGTGPGLQVNGHIKAYFGWPGSAAAGANAGTSPPAPILTWPGANDIRGTVTFGTGTSPTAGAQANLTFGKNYGAAPIVVVCPANAATAALQPYVSATSTSGFNIALGVAPAASQANTVYAVTYFVIE